MTFVYLCLRFSSQFEDENEYETLQNTGLFYIHGNLIKLRLYMKNTFRGPEWNPQAPVDTRRHRGGAMLLGTCACASPVQGPNGDLVRYDRVDLELRSLLCFALLCFLFFSPTYKTCITDMQARAVLSFIRVLDSPLILPRALVLHRRNVL